MKIRLCEARGGRDNNFGECEVLELTRAPGLTRSAPSPGCAPNSHDTSGHALRCGPIRGSRCWGSAPPPTPSSAVNGRGQAQAHGFAFFSTQVCIAGLWHGNTVAHQRLPCCTWSENSSGLFKGGS